MTLEQIRYFVTSVETGGFSAAARQLYVSHSTVSRGVTALEEELGVALFYRNTRHLRLTAAGEAAFQQGQALLRQAVQLQDSVARYRTLQQLHITCIGAYIPRFYELIRKFQALHPEVELIMEQAEQRPVTQKLCSGGTDLGVSFSYSWPDDPGLDCLVVEQGAFCALASPGHPLAARAFLTREELAEDPELLGENPFRPAAGRNTDIPRDVQSIVLQIKTGCAITVLPEHAAAEFGQGCVRIPIRGAQDAYQLLLGWRRENTSAPLQAAIAFFRNALENRNPD